MPKALEEAEPKPGPVGTQMKLPTTGSNRSGKRRGRRCQRCLWHLEEAPRKKGSEKASDALSKVRQTGGGGGGSGFS